jgi:hypothetical protein
MFVLKSISPGGFIFYGAKQMTWGNMRDKIHRRENLDKHKQISWMKIKNSENIKRSNKKGLIG